MWLDLVLVLLTAAAGWRLKDLWVAARDRQRLVLSERVGPSKLLPPPPIAPVQPAVAADYLDVAQKMLFSKDRNPTVIVEAEPPKPKPPMPPLPTAHGLIFFGDQRVIILAVNPGAEQKSYHAGDQVGKFKLVSFDSDKVTFEWDGDNVEKRYQDLLPKEKERTAVAAAPATASPLVVSTATSTSDSSKSTPGADMGAGFRTCQLGDTSPAGTVADGYRKVLNPTPFGNSCFWEQVKK